MTMDLTSILVLVGGAAAIVFVIWYFFGEKQAVSAETRGSEQAAPVQEVNITVKGGYEPDVISVRKGLPVRLNFYRAENASCSEQVVFPDFGIVRDLPAFKTSSIEFTPANTGEFPFTCGMRMLRGKLIVREKE